MPKLHITLVGQQTMPVFNGIKFSSPDKVLFIYSKESSKEKNIISYVMKEYMPDVEIINNDPLDPVDLEAIENAVINYSKEFKDYEISLNISSGTKPWTYYFTKTFVSIPNTTVFYVDQNNDVWDLKTKKVSHIEFDMDTQFKLTNNPLKNYKLFSDYTLEDFETIKKIEEIRKFNHQTFNKLTILDKTTQKQWNTNQTGKFVEEDSYLEWNKNGTSTLHITKKSKSMDLVLDSENGLLMLLNSHWFEVKVAQIVSKWSAVKEIRLNCVFPPRGSQDKEHPKNEIDIIADIGNKLLFIECKTNISNSTDIDKFNSAVTTYGGKGSKKVFVVENEIESKSLEKMADNNIIGFSFKRNMPFPEDSLITVLTNNASKINT